MEIVKLENGILGLKTERAEARFEALVDEDRVWEYLTELFNNAVEEETSVLKNDEVAQMKKAMEVLMKQVEQVNENVTSLAQQGIAIKEVVTPQTQERVPTNSNPKPIENTEPAKLKPKKKKPGTMGGFAAMAGKMKARNN